jgi:ATP-dependent DNA helicase RecQ
MRHVVDVLRGEKTDAVARNRHDQLALFGIGRDRTQDFWRGVVRQLIARGAVSVKSGEYASLELVTDEARPILRGETQVMLAEAPNPLLGETRPASRARTPRPVEKLPEGSETLFDALRAWRMTVAKAQSVPPYVIFHDSVLRDIAAVCPATIAELAEIKGMGGTKLEHYGKALLEIVQKRQSASVLQ